MIENEEPRVSWFENYISPELNKKKDVGIQTSIMDPRELEKIN